MQTEMDAVAKKVDILEFKLIELEKLHMSPKIETNKERIKEAVHQYLTTSSEISTMWKSKLSAVDEVKSMRKNSRGY